jgi:hypothetical protein
VSAVSTYEAYPMPVQYTRTSLRSAAITRYVLGLPGVESVVIHNTVMLVEASVSDVDIARRRGGRVEVMLELYNTQTLSFIVVGSVLDALSLAARVVAAVDAASKRSRAYNPPSRSFNSFDTGGM